MENLPWLGRQRQAHPQALIHLNDQPMGPIAPNARLGTQTEAPDTINMWKRKDTVIVQMLAMDRAMILWTSSPTVPEKVTIYWNLQWATPLRCGVSGWVGISTWQPEPEGNHQ